MRTELAREGGCPARASFLLRGWIAHQRILPDGRRQIVGFTLPGELFGRTWGSQDPASTTQVALTDILVCPTPTALVGSRLQEAYHKDWLARRSYLIANVTRLGRMDARERLCDMLLELLERLTLSDEVDGRTFAVPLTQECLADALGLTPVHVNRTIQACRRAGDVTWRSGLVTVHDPAGLARSVGRMLDPIEMECLCGSGS